MFDKELIKALPESVKWIAHNGAGYDQIDIDACKAKGKLLLNVIGTTGVTQELNLLGITVSNTPGAVDDGTATTALYLIISSLRQFSRAEKSLHKGTWKNGLAPAHDPSSRTLGILGLGGIGLRTAELCRGFPMRVIYHSRSPAKKAPDWAKYYSSMDEFLKEADVLSLHVPLKEETVGLIGEREIRLLKPGSVIVNTARGKVLDDDALIKALQDGHVSQTYLHILY